MIVDRPSAGSAIKECAAAKYDADLAASVDIERVLPIPAAFRNPEPSGYSRASSDVQSKSHRPETCC